MRHQIMGLFKKDKYLVQILKHSLQDLLVALGIVIFAGIFAAVEMLCEKLEMPQYFVLGVRIIAIALFIIDGIVVVGTALKLAIKVLFRKNSKDDE